MARFRHRNTGQFVSAEWAARHPKKVVEIKEVESEEAEVLLEVWEAEFSDADFFDEYEFDATPDYEETP